MFRFLLLPVLLAAVTTGHADEGLPNHQLYTGYGTLSTTDIAEQIASTIVNAFFDSPSDSGKSSHVVQVLGYTYRVKDAWLVTVVGTRERFPQSGELKTAQLGLRNEFVHNPQFGAYWGVSAGRGNYNYASASLGIRQNALQLDFGLRVNRGPLFGYLNLGVGDAGVLGAGVGVSF